MKRGADEAVCLAAVTARTVHLKDFATAIELPVEAENALSVGLGLPPALEAVHRQTEAKQTGDRHEGDPLEGNIEFDLGDLVIAQRGLRRSAGATYKSL